MSPSRSVPLLNGRQHNVLTVIMGDRSLPLPPKKKRKRYGDDYADSFYDALRDNEWVYLGRVSNISRRTISDLCRMGLIEPRGGEYDPKYAMLEAYRLTKRMRLWCAPEITEIYSAQIT